MNDNKYWNSYYSLNSTFLKPSNFAIFAKKFIKKDNIILEIATGNGRDAFYLKKFCKKVYAIDNSKIAIDKNKNKIKKLNIKNLYFKKMSVSNLNKLVNISKINFIYARFFLHSIDQKKENLLLKNFFKIFNSKTLMALEFRTNKDVLMKSGKKISKNERYTDHYRRFINVNTFQKKILKNNGKIIYKKSGLNLSKTKTENPHLCRMIIQSN